jgi:radical SAM superfamily enzyme YgiQ (UPF0313 family)
LLAAGADQLVRGDYELVFEGLVRDGLELAPGVTRRHQGQLVTTPPPLAKDLDALPWADRSVLDASRYVVRGTRRRQATVHVQRGCPFPCSYCLVASVSGRKARHRSPDDVARELAALVAEGYRFFYLRAETLTLDRRWARELGHAIARLAPTARWVSATRVDTTDEATLAALKAGGCYGLSFGVETGSARIGDLIRKPPDLEQTREVFRACDRQGIASLMYVMLGFLWETPQTQAETEAFVHAVRPDLLTLYWAHPYPGTPYFEQVRAAGLAIDPRQAQAAAALEPHELSRAVIRRRAAVMTARHYARPTVVASVARKLWPVLTPTRAEAKAFFESALQ